MHIGRPHRGAKLRGRLQVVGIASGGGEVGYVVSVEPGLLRRRAAVAFEHAAGVDVDVVIDLVGQHDHVGPEIAVLHVHGLGNRVAGGDYRTGRVGR